MSWTKVLLAAAVAALLLLAAPRQAGAIADPDDLIILAAYAYSGVLESGDLMVLAHYEVDYVSTPTTPARDAFLVKLKFNAVEVQTTRPVSSFHELGYSEHISGFYFTADEADALGLTFTEDYSVQVIGNPAEFPSPPSVESALVLLRPVASTLTDLRTDALDIMFDIELEWSVPTAVDLVAGNILTATGAGYIEQAVPNIRAAAASIFSGSIVPASFQSFENAHTLAERQVREALLEGTVIDNAVESMALNFLGDATEVDVMYGILFFGGFLVVAGFYMAFPQSKVDFLFVAFPVAATYGAISGTLDPVFAGLVAFLAGLGFVNQFFYKGAG